MLQYFRFSQILVVWTLILFIGCSGIGPGTVTRDRSDYINAITESWKKQMLLNMVKLRYLDAPVFLEVASVISQYSVEGQINLSAGWSNGINGDGQTLGGSGRYTDRPTITYAPLTGAKFTRSLMTPIPINGILSMIQADFPVDFLFRLTVQTINGIDNRFGGELGYRSADPRFYRVIQSLGKIQQLGGLGMRIKPRGEKSAIVIFFKTKPTKEIRTEMSTVRQILGLNMDAQEFRVVYGSIAADDREIAILTRSMVRIMVELASYIDVPEKDVAEGRVYAPPVELVSGPPALIRVHSGDSRSTDAYVTVRYRNQWFWIDDRDLSSKRVFSFLMLFFSLTEKDTLQAAPIVTVPTN